MNNEAVQGLVTERLPDSRFRILVNVGAGDNEIIAYLGGKMKLNKIQLLIGDKVLVVLDPYGGKATNRIIRRL